MTPEQPRTYKHQLTAEEFTFAFTATEEEFAARADEMREKGVERLTGRNIREKYNIYVGYKTDKIAFTLIMEAKIIAVPNEPIIFYNVQVPVPSLVLWRSSVFASLVLSSCTLARLRNERIQNNATSFLLIESTTGDVSIEQSETGDFSIRDRSTTGSLFIEQSITGGFSIEQSTTSSFSIRGQSRTGGFSIEQSTISNFSVHEGSTTGGIFIEQSETGNFSIRDRSTTGSLFIEQSITGGFSIEQSTTGDFSVREQSTTGDFSIEQSKAGNFSIREKSTIGDFSIREQSTTGFFYIREQSITGNFLIKQSLTGGFSILEQSTTSNFLINQSTTSYFSIGQSTTGNFSIEQSKTGNFLIDSSEVVNFYATGLLNSFYLTKANITQFRLHYCQLPELRIISGCRVECYVAYSAINLIDLQHLTLGKESIVSLFNCTVYACLMEEFVVLGSLFFRQINKAIEPFVWSIADIEDGVNKSMLTLLQEHIKGYEEHKKRLVDELYIEQPTFRIAQSSLGKTEFTNCDLEGFRFEFNNAKITETFISGGTIPQENIFIHGEPKDTLAWHEQKVSAYNQFKKIFGWW